MIECIVRGAKFQGKVVYLPWNSVAVCLCKLARRRYLTFDDVKVIAAPEPDGLGMTVLLMPNPPDETLRNIVYPRRH